MIAGSSVATAFLAAQGIAAKSQVILGLLLSPGSIVGRLARDLILGQMFSTITTAVIEEIAGDEEQWSTATHILQGGLSLALSVGTSIGVAKLGGKLLGKAARSTASIAHDVDNMITNGRVKLWKSASGFGIQTLIRKGIGVVSGIISQFFPFDELLSRSPFTAGLTLTNQMLDRLIEREIVPMIMNGTGLVPPNDLSLIHI